MTVAIDRDGPLAPGSTIDRFRVERLIGEGGMGSVHEVVDPTIGRRFALKILRGAFANDPAMVARLEREARATAELCHPAIVETLGFGRTEDGRPWVLLPLLEGRTLREELDARGRLPPDEAWAILREVGDALAAAHAAGIVHRDLKPENVFLERPSGRAAARVRLLDFGIAKVDPALAADPAALVKLTQTGMPLGTPIYMAPEQWWCQAVDGRTDQYAFGAVLFELLTGQPPFPSRHFAELLQAHLHEAPPELSERETGGRPEVGALVRRLLEKRAEGRFRDFEEVLAEGDEAFGVVAARSGPRPVPRPDAPRGDAIAATEAALPPPDVALALAATAAAVDRSSGAAGRRGEVEQGGRARIALALTGALGIAGLVALGYPGEAPHDVADWFRIGGAGMLTLPFAYATALVAVASAIRLRERRRGPGWGRSLAAILPVVAMAPSTYMGWTMVREGVSRHPDAGERFHILASGTWELNAARFVGFALGSLGALAVAASAGVRTRGRVAGAPSPWESGLTVSLGAAAAAAIPFAVASDAAAVAPVLAALAAVCAIDVLLPIALDERSRRDVVHRSLASLAALLAACGLGASRAEARDAWNWRAPTTRAERVEALVAAALEQDRLASAAFVVVSAYCVLAALRIARQPEPLAPSRLPAVAWVAILTLPAITALDLAFHGRFFDARRAAVEALGDSLATGMELSPPEAPAALSARPRVAPALQITPSAVALNGKAVARLDALDGAAVQQSVLHDLTNAAATTAPPAAGEVAPDLSVLVDRRVPWSSVRRVLGLAREAGARHVQVLFTRGAAPRLPPRAPRETGFLLPRDFAALDVELVEAGLDLGDDAAFAEVAQALAASAGEPRLAARR